MFCVRRRGCVQLRAPVRRSVRIHDYDQAAFVAVAESEMRQASQAGD
jgi:hypothetical protein